MIDRLGASVVGAMDLLGTNLAGVVMEMTSKRWIAIRDYGHACIAGTLYLDRDSWTCHFGQEDAR